MTITREQVADLQPGDVVELRDERWPEGSVIRGPLKAEHRALCLLGGIVPVRFEDGSPSVQPQRTLTVVSRAPRPLYVNHPRTEFATGDVVGDGDIGGHPKSAWIVNARVAGFPWFVGHAAEWLPRSELPARLRLLVDGDTGQVVPS